MYMYMNVANNIMSHRSEISYQLIFSNFISAEQNFPYTCTSQACPMVPCSVLTPMGNPK